MNEQERGREYLADLLGESVPRATWPDGLHKQLEAFLEAAPDLLPPTHPGGPRSRRLLESRGPRPDVVLVDDVVSDLPPWQWWKSLRAQPHGVGMLPPNLLPDRIRYAPQVEHGRHERSVQRWARAHDATLPAGQERRLVKFLDDWTRP